MTKRKDPDVDMRSGLKRKRKRRTPEEIERARKSGEPVRDQSGGNRSRKIKVNGKFLSAEDRGEDRRFSDEGRQLKQVKDKIKIKDELRMNLRDKISDIKSKLGKSMTESQDRMLSKLEGDHRQALLDLSDLRSQESSLVVKLRNNSRAKRNFMRL